VFVFTEISQKTNVRF